MLEIQRKETHLPSSSGQEGCVLGKVPASVDFQLEVLQASNSVSVATELLCWDAFTPIRGLKGG